MGLSCLILSGMLLAQTPAGGTVHAAPAPAKRLEASDVVAATVKLPADSTILGRPVTLLETLSAARDPARQLEVIRAYWRLSAAMGEYHAWSDAASRLRELSASDPRQHSALNAARTEALEATRAAEAAARGAQSHLARAAALAATLPPPLPADDPLAREYVTRFSQYQSSPSINPRAGLIDRLLPVVHAGIKARAEAVLIAEDSLHGALRQYENGQVELAVVLTSVERLAEQRQALMSDIYRYNDNIAEYVLIVSPGASPALLVPMLIGSTSAAGVPAAIPRGPLTARPLAGTPGTLGGVQPATYLNPGAPANVGPSPIGFAPRYEFQTPPGASGLAPAAREPEPTLAPPKPSTSDATPAATPAAPRVESSAKEPLPAILHTARRMNADGLAGTGARSSVATTSALYPGLENLDGAARAQRLGEVLHLSRNLPPQAGQPMELNEAVRLVPTSAASDRRGAIEAYWQAAEQAAAYQVIAQQIEVLKQLAQTVGEQRTRPGVAEAMLRLQAARQAAEADLQAAHAALLESQFELARRINRRSAWPLPSTPPHAGTLNMKLESQPAALVQNWPIRRLAESVPGLHQTMVEQAAAIVQADMTQAQLRSALQTGTASVDQVLSEVRYQTAATLAFLNTLTAYNRAIAEYALTVLSSASADELVGSLVRPRSTITPGAQP